MIFFYMKKQFNTDNCMHIKKNTNQKSSFSNMSVNTLPRFINCPYIELALAYRTNYDTKTQYTGVDCVLLHKGN